MIDDILSSFRRNEENFEQALPDQMIHQDLHEIDSLQDIIKYLGEDPAVYDAVMASLDDGQLSPAEEDQLIETFCFSSNVQTLDGYHENQVVTRAFPQRYGIGAGSKGGKLPDDHPLKDGNESTISSETGLKQRHFPKSSSGQGSHRKKVLPNTDILSVAMEEIGI